MDKDNQEHGMLSPLPKVIDPGMSFPEAISEVIEGKKITKREWNDKNIFGFLGQDGHLKIAFPGKLTDWILSDGDLKGKDWEVLIEGQLLTN